MSKDLTKRTGPKAAPKRAEDAASRLKTALMEDALGRVLGKDGEKQPVPGKPHVILALANYTDTAVWDRAQTLQRRMFEAAAGDGLAMKLAYYGEDNDYGVRRCRITSRWIDSPDDMAGTIERAKCNCGCFVLVHTVLAQAVKEAADRPLRAVVVVGDAFHDDPDELAEAALSATQLHRAGTQVVFVQLSDDPDTARGLQYLARLSGAAFLPFNSRQEREFEEMWKALSAFAAGGEEGVKKAGGQAATLLLQHLKQAPMPNIEEPMRVELKSPVPANPRRTSR
jgi:hypothetical protein